MNIPAWPQADENELAMLQRVLQSEQWGGFHAFVREFETRFALYQHAIYGISTFNGTVSLELALSVLGIGPGDEVIMPAISFISTATAVSRAGAIPVFVDIEPYSFNIDPDGIRQAIGPRTKAVIPVHFGGTMCKIEEIVGICRQHGLAVIEDAAHAHGSEWNGKRAGSYGEFGSFSFQNGKVLSAGEGGILLTSDEKLAEAAQSIANQGRTIGKSFYEHDRLGTNFRISAFQAAVLLAQLERLSTQTEHRTASAHYLRQLAGLDEIVWQTIPEQMTQNPFYLLLGRVRGGREARDHLHQAMTAAGVPCTPFYPHTLYQNQLYRGVAPCRVLPCPNAEQCVDDAFWFPHRVLLSDRRTIEEIGAVLRNVLVQSSSVHWKQA